MNEVVIDSSAVMALALEELEAQKIATQLASAERRLMSSFSVLETAVSLERKKGVAGKAMLEEFVALNQIEVVPFDAELLGLAREAWRRFGKGRHPAALNLGDCCAYATAKRLGLPLLFKGADFSQTDIETAG